MCDYGRLNFEYLEAENRLLEPQILRGKAGAGGLDDRNWAGSAPSKRFAGRKLQLLLLVE